MTTPIARRAPSPRVPVLNRVSLRHALLLVALTAVAALLRVYRLGRWPFEGDELFTLRDSVALRVNNPRPLIYLLNHYLVLPFRSLDEFGLRLLPAAFGILAVPTLYFAVRRLVGARPALIAAALLATSNLHVYHSQYARYWSLVFLLSLVYPFAVYLGIRRADSRWLAIGLVTGTLATLAHPASVLLVGGLALWLVLAYSRRDVWPRDWGGKQGWWGILLAAALAVIIAIQYVPVLYEWIAARDATPAQAGEHFLHLPRGLGIKQVAFLLSYAEGLTVPLVLAGAVGIYLLWLKYDRQLAILLLCLFGFPTISLTMLSLRTAVSTSYLLPTAPVFFLGAAVFLDWLTRLDRELRPRWLLPVVLTALVILPGMPSLLSQYRDGRRLDFRSAARWLEARVQPDDLVFSDQHRVLAHYLPGRQVSRLNPDVPVLAGLTGGQSRSRQVVWLVIPLASHSFRTNAKLGSFMGRVYQRCQLQSTIGVSRVDFRQYQLQIYRCPAGGSLAAPANDAPATVE